MRRTALALAILGLVAASILGPIALGRPAATRAPDAPAAGNGPTFVSAPDARSSPYLRATSAGHEGAVRAFELLADDEGDAGLDFADAGDGAPVALFFRFVMTQSGGGGAGAAMDTSGAAPEPAAADGPAPGGCSPSPQAPDAADVAAQLLWATSQSSLALVGVAPHRGVSSGPAEPHACVSSVMAPPSANRVSVASESVTSVAAPGWLLQALWTVALASFGAWALRAAPLPGLGLGLFSRLSRDDVLDHDRRAHLYEAIRAEPGVPFGHLCGRLAMAHGVAQHHLRLLEHHELVRRVRDGRTTRWYPRGPKFDPPSCWPRRGAASWRSSAPTRASRRRSSRRVLANASSPRGSTSCACARRASWRRSAGAEPSPGAWSPREARRRGHHVLIVGHIGPGLPKPMRAPVLVVLLVLVWAPLANAGHEGATHTMTAKLPFAREAAAVVAAGDHVYILGGYDGTKRTDQILRYEPAADALTVMNGKLPSPRNGMAALWTGTYVFLFGGFGCTTGVTSFCDEILRYDPAADSVVQMDAKLQAMSNGQTGGANSAFGSAVWTGTHGYLFGGASNLASYRRIWRYDAAADTLTQMGAALPNGLQEASAVWTGVYAYLFGGQVSNPVGPTNQIVRYDPAKDEATLLSATLPDPTNGTAAVWTGDHALIFGGWHHTEPRATILQFDLAERVAALDVALPSARHHLGAAWVEGAAYAVAGFDGGNRLDHVVRFTPASGTSDSPTNGQGPTSGAGGSTNGSPAAGWVAAAAGVAAAALFVRRRD